MYRIKILFSILLFLIVSQSFIISQEQEINGSVKDDNTGELLPFVHIVYNPNNEGITTDIDGHFKIQNIPKIEFLKFSYVGYETLVLAKSKCVGKSYLDIKLKKKTFDINEIIIHPGENPAHRIINAVIKNKNANAPNNLESYKYKAYHKMYFTADIEDLFEKIRQDSLSVKDSAKVDSAYTKAKAFFSTKHMFMMESVSERKYKRPGKIKEKVLVSRVSGFKQPSFILLASQLQSFSFYDEIFNLMDKRYISPISNGATRRYFFNIADTSYTERGDTVFSISYRPKRGKNFEGLKGILNINTYNYALQSVVAEPFDEDDVLGIRIKQNCKLIDNKHWFPYELNTDLIFKSAEVEEMGHSVPMVGVSKNYIDEIELNKDYKNAEFSAIEIEVDKKSFTREDSIWNKHRKYELNKQELGTYQMIDSVGDKYNFDAKLKIAKAVMKSYIPVGFIDINPFGLLNFNMFEGYRPGLAIKTNDKISKYFSLGGYGAYGFKDKVWKYGGNLDINISNRQEIKLKFKYFKDVFETSGYKFFEQNKNMMPTENYRYFLLKDMSYQTAYSLGFEFRALKHFKANIFSNVANRWNTSNYVFVNKGIDDESSKKYLFHEVGIQLKYSPNEKKAYFDGEIFSLNNFSTPVFSFNYTRGLKSFDGDFDYTKLEAKLDISFLTKSFGRTYMQFAAGKLFGDLPYFMMYNGHGSYYKFDVDVANSFATMRMNEFLSDEFVAVYFRQDFGSLLFKSKKFQPKIVFATNVTFGQLKKPELHKNITFNTLEKGYYESGILINNIIPYFKFMGYGFGVYYRYGDYALPKTNDNFAYKLTLTLNL